MVGSLLKPLLIVCGASLTVKHIFSCLSQGYPSINHNEIRDLTATLLTKVRNDVHIEPNQEKITEEVMTRETAITTEGARFHTALMHFGSKVLKKTS